MSEDKQQLLRRMQLVWNQLDEGFSTERQQASMESPLTLPIVDGARLGIDRKNRYHLLLSLKEGEAQLRRRLTAGITIRTGAFETEEGKGRWIDVISEERWRFAIEPFAADAVQLMTDGSMDLKTLSELADEYRALWKQVREPMDSRRQRGLIGEMLVVQRLASVSSLAASIERWVGPFDELHDIVDDDWRVEVKSYAEEPPRVRISEVEQLDCRIDCRLTVAAVHLKGTDEGRTLPEFIDDFVTAAESAGVGQLASDRLLAAGWDEIDREEYHSRFVPGRLVFCPIHVGSPVFPARLLEDMPHSVSKIAYRLALNDLHQLDGSDQRNLELVCSAGDWLEDDLGFTLSDQDPEKDPSRTDLLIETERMYREIIHRAYVGSFGLDWWNEVPKRTQQDILDKVAHWKRSGQKGLDKPNRRFWDASTTGSLGVAMFQKAKWGTIFGELFGMTSGNFRRHWEIFQDLRNVTFHSNDPISDDHLQEGIAATNIIRGIGSAAMRKLDGRED